MNRVLRYFHAFICLFLASASPVLAEGMSGYVRLTVDQKTKEPTSLESSVHELTLQDSKGSFKVDLVSAVHIADSLYYQQLNSRFKNYDAVLYELVAGQEDVRHFEKHSRKDPKDRSEVSFLQSGMAGLLGLSFQLEQVDYSAKNFVHADMSPELLSQDMKKRGESFQSILLKAMAKSSEIEKGPADLSDMLLLLSGKHSSTGLKRLIARQFGDMEGFVEALNGKSGISLIHGRNAVAIETLKRELSLEKRNIAIFYGAAHMPDMLKQIKAVWPLTSDRIEWYKAWDLTLQPVN